MEPSEPTVLDKAGRVFRDLADDLSSGLPEDRLADAVTVRAATSGEATGRRILTRAAITAGLGGAVIAIVSAAFGSRMFAADARIWGMFTGLGIMALAALSPIDTTRQKLIPGALILVLAIVSLPIALGGYLFGTLAAVVGGAMLVGYEPPQPPVHIETRPASYLRRFVALLVDFSLAFVVQRFLYWLVPPLFSNTFNVVVSWAVVWFVVAIEPVILTRRTAGRLLLSLRVADWRTGDRSATSGAAMRETLRGLIAIGTLFAVWAAALKETFSVGNGLLMLAVVGGLVGLSEAADGLGRASRTISAHDVVVTSVHRKAARADDAGVPGRWPGSNRAPAPEPTAPPRQARFNRSLSIGLAAGLVFSAYTLSSPQAVFALAGQPGSPGARLYTQDVIIDRMGLYGSSVDGVSVTHFAIGRLERGRALTIERDFVASSIVPGARDWTVRMTAPVAVAPSGLNIYSSHACVRRVGIVGFGLLDGLLDGFINPAIAHGHHPSLITMLINLVGPSGLVKISVGQMWSEAMVVNAGHFASSGVRLEVVPRSVSPVFAGGCL